MVEIECYTFSGGVKRFEWALSAGVPLRDMLMIMLFCLTAFCSLIFERYNICCPNGKSNRMTSIPFGNV